MMIYKTLDSLQIQASQLGFGCWAIGGHGYGHVNDQESISAIQFAFEQGINLYDTANVYGFGHSETVLSKALGQKINKCVIVTKCGLHWTSSGEVFLDGRPESLKNSIENSLRRLRVNSISVCLLHKPDPKVSLADSIGALLDLKQQGKIQVVGASNLSKDELQLVGNRLAVFQAEFSVAKQHNLESFQVASVNFGMINMAYGVLLRGLLTGKYLSDKIESHVDTRENSPEFRGEKLKRNLEVLKTITLIANRFQCLPADVATSFVLQNPLISVALVGLKTVDQVRSSLRYLHVNLTAADMALLKN